MKSVLPILILLFFSNDIFAQLDRPVVPPSPNASALIRQANIEVGHYTGVPNISIPFGSVPGKDISVPISIDYHASGIKVQDVASSVGLGWNLNAGGAITRVVQGIPDGIKSNCASGTAGYFYNISELCDGERDLFYFSIMGRSGKMFLDDAGYVQTMPYQDIRIVPGVGPNSVGYWSITDENGYQYIFGETSAEQEQITYATGSTTYTDKYTFISTWYLSRIVSPKGVQVATFNYSTGSDFEYLMYHDQAIKDPNSLSFPVKTVNTKIKVKAAKYINTITTTTASVQFSYLYSRTDLVNSWQLSSLSFKDQDGIIKKKYHLIQDYFLGEFNSVSNGRLRLASIKEGVQDPIALYSFLYKEIIGGSYVMNPNRGNPKFDHFGYYNTSSNSSYVDNRIPIESGMSAGASKTPNWADALVFSLTEINNNSGGRTVFESEGSLGRGLRIKSVTNYDGTKLVAKSTFTYSGAQGYSTPVYSYTGYDGNIVWTSSSFKDLYDLSGTNVGYSSVTETFLDGSKIIRDFTNYTDYADTPPVVGKYLADPPANPPVFQSTSPVNGVPFALSTSRFWMRGLPKSIRVYDSNTNPLTKTEITYLEGAAVSTVSNTAVHNYQQTGGQNPKITYISGVYNFTSKPVNVDQVKSYTYDQADYFTNVLSTTTYAYHSKHKTFPVSVIRQQTGANVEEKITYRYPTDVTGTGSQPTTPQPLADGIWYMVNRNVISPIEELLWYMETGSTYKIVGGKLTAYRKNTISSRPLLNSTYSLSIQDPLTALTDPITGLNSEAKLTSNGTVFTYDSRYRLMETFMYDEATSNVTSVQSSDGLTNNFEWGVNNSLVTASIASTGINQMRSEYTYNSVLGMVTSKDPNNLYSKYEYDMYGRIKILKDNDDNILQRYRYHSANETEFNVDFTLPTGALRNQSLSFTVYQYESLGSAAYVWNFGDGTTANSNQGNHVINHTYTSAGTYTVTLTKTNPEYGTISTSKQLTVN